MTANKQQSATESATTGDQERPALPITTTADREETTSTPAPPAYAELHCLTNFSFLRGASHPAELVDRAAELGYTALAITDRNSLAGVVRAHLAAREHDLHLIIGVEVTPVDAPPLVLLAPDRDAYARLARLITRGRLRTPKGQCTLYHADLEDLCKNSTLIALLSDPPLTAANPNLISRSLDLSISPPSATIPNLDLSISRSLDLFPSRLYLAARLDATTPDDQRLTTLRTISERFGVPLVATNAVHYHVPERRYLHDVLTCIREKCTLHNAGTRLFANAERHLRPREEIARRYADHADLIARTVEIAERCTFSLDELKYEYPHELVPPGQDAMTYLEQLTWQGAAKRYNIPSRSEQRPKHESRSLDLSISRSLPVPTFPHSHVPTPPSLPSATRTLLNSELALIRELHYEHYFLTVWDIVRFARERGILCQGRGSAANSAVCYCLGVTAVDPEKHDLLFERFVSKERNEPPDIDVDFEHERREEVFQYIYEKYGRERAAITAEVIRYRPRSAVRDVGKALGLSLDRVDVLAKALDWWSNEPVPPEALRQAGLNPNDRTVQMVVRLVRQLIGFPRHLSQHVGGFVITETPLCEIVPLENGAMPDRTFIEWDKNDIDALGILKVDCLALGMLTALSKAFGMLGTYYGERSRDREIERSRNATSTARVSENEPTLPVEGDSHESQVHLSRSKRVAQSDRTVQDDLSHHAGAARYRTVRTDQPDAAGGGFDSEQHRGRQCTPDDARLSQVPVDRSRITRRTGDADHHRRRAATPVTASDTLQRNTGSASAAASADEQSAQQAGEVTGANNASPPSSLDLSISRSLDLFPPQSLNPSIPQSLLDIPSEDPAVYDMICAADTVGVFQIESRAQMSMLPRLKPRCFYDLVIEVAIVRPGPIQGGMIHPFLRRRNGEEPVWYPSPAVQKVLEKTLGVPLFQEQVMRLAVVAAGFSPGEADHLRRSMAAWRLGGQIEQFQVRLVRGMLDNGYSRDFAERIFTQIRGFGEYGFPESHAASFALLVYASAWLKRYHPATFTGAILNSLPMGFYAPAQLVRDAQRHGVTVRSIDVNYSQYDCTLESPDVPVANRRHSEETSARAATSTSIPQSPNPSIPPPALRLGYRLVRGLSAEKVRGVEAARREGVIRSLHQLARRRSVSRETLLRLAAADAFRSLGLNRRQALWQILAETDDDLPLFADLPPDEDVADLPRMPLEETVVHDYESLGFSLNAHPLELVRSDLQKVRVLTSAQLQATRNGKRVRVAGIVTHRQRPATAKGLVFMTLEDETGHVNLIVRPQVWERYRAVARAKIALIAEGTIERQEAVIHVQVQRFEDLAKRITPANARSRDFR